MAQNHEPFNEADLKAIQAVIEAAPQREADTMTVMLREITHLRMESKHQENDRMAGMVIELTRENTRLKEELNQALLPRGGRK